MSKLKEGLDISMAKSKKSKSKVSARSAIKAVTTIDIVEVKPPTKESVKALRTDPLVGNLFFPRLSSVAGVVGKETAAEDFAKTNARKRP